MYVTFLGLLVSVLHLVGYSAGSVLLFLADKKIRTGWQNKRKMLLESEGLTKEGNTMTVQVALNVPKECKEIIDAITSIAADIRAKKSIAEISGNALPKLIVAVEGYDQVDEEVKSDGKDDLAAYIVKELVAIF